MRNKRIYLILFFLFIIFSITVKADNNQNYYFYSENCLDCISLENDINDFCEKNNIEKILFDANSLINLKEILKDLNYDGKIKMPLLIYNGDIFVGENAIKNLINTNKQISPIFLFLGFLDGLNPCALSILMIFSSFLITLDKKKELLLVGLSFIFGETLCNFLLGLGLLKITQISINYKVFSNIIYIFALGVCLYVFILNIIDIINALKKKQEIKNLLPIKIRYKINELLSKSLSSSFFVIGVFILGFIIAILEFGCTGQVYLPTILYLQQIDTNFILTLVLYNLFFAMPLIIFLFLSLLINPNTIKNNTMKYSFLIKIIVNIILIFLFIQIFSRLL